MDIKTKLLRKISPYLYVLPALLIFSVFLVYPLVNGFYMSFFNWSGLAGTAKFIGLKNYFRALFDDKIFWLSLRNNLLFMAACIVFELGFGVLLAEMLNKLKFVNIFRVIYLFPYIIPVVGSGILFRLVFNYNFGLLNKLLEVIRLDFLIKPWLGSFPEAFYAVIFVSVWTFLGYSTVLFLSAMQRIPKEIYDAAEIDGVNSWQRFSRITMPLIREMITVVLGLTIIGSLTTFGLFYVMTCGGPYHQTEVIALWIIRQAFDLDNMGYAAALSVILFILVLLISVVYLKWRGKETYEY